MYRLLKFVVILFFTVGCHEIFEPEVEIVPPYLVIEGLITNQPGICHVQLSNSKSYNESPSFRGVPGAIVQVEDNSGNIIRFHDHLNGVYSAELDESTAAKVGETYTLRVITSEGDEYLSKPQTVVASPDEVKLQVAWGREYFITEDSYGNPLELDYGGINILIETKGVLPSDNYYMYSYTGFEQHHAILQFEISFFDIYRHRRLSGRYLNQIHTANADEFSDKRVRNDKLLFIAETDMRYYPVIYPDSFTLTANMFEGLIFKLDQMAISPDVYTFYNDLENLLAAEGQIFDPAIPQITGNISCISDTTKQVVGVFAAANLYRKYAYIHVRSSDHLYISELDSLPEIWLDTCSWGRPESWIRPPF